MNGLINNSWVVSIASILITVAVTPALQQVSEWIRSRRGALTGTYLALSQTGGPKFLLAETIRCRHIGDRLKGSITARAELTLNSHSDIEKSVPAAAGVYRFSGRMRARQLLLSYWSPAKASQNGGTITMVLDANGTTFRGIWCGTATDGEVITGPCMWIRDSVGAIEGMSMDQLAQVVESALRSVANPWRETDSSLIRMSKLIYMTKAMDTLRCREIDD